MDILAIALLGFFAAGYFVLAGADLGVGMLLTYLGRGAGERRLVLASIGPFFLGNEVWLVATAGVLIGCFPTLEGELFQGQFLVLLPLVTGWVVRDAGLWWRGRGATRAWRTVMDALVVCGSWTVALSWGALYAGLLTGDPVRPASGGLTVFTALAVALLFAAHGLGFAALRLTGRPYERARQLVGCMPRLHSFAPTAVVMAALPLLAGSRLPLMDTAADSATLSLLVPALLVVTPGLVAAQVWLWRTFRDRVTRPSYL
ncbi:cytochrome d ubiquinol oxidase subunit II [Streptomyces flavidovirens]|uniref:cytochrome d ubiquinol oxidase subunit II n=1 Tax=Streptomyces flavidovirens TaxID=67298 RepID=UPI00367E7E4C